MTMKKDRELLYREQVSKCTDKNADETLFSNGLKLDDYYIDEEYDSICFINERGAVMDWLIEDEVFANYCKNYLRQKGVKVLKKS
jgi:hypothetical protein